MAINSLVENLDPLRGNAALLLRLRWVAVLGQLATIAIAQFLLRVELPLAPLLAIISLTAFTNVLFAWWEYRHRRAAGVADRAENADGAGADGASVARPDERIAAPGVFPVGPGDELLAGESEAGSGPIRLGQGRPGRRSGQAMLAAVLALDLVALTGLLYFAGGAANPFSIFYLVNLTLCAMLLPEGWGWALTSLAAGGLLLLFIAFVPIPELHQWVDVGPAPTIMHLSMEQWGRMVATVGCGLVIIHFVARITRQLEQTAGELQRMERERLRSEKLEALGTFAAGAAHELATPLSTIAVVASELVRNLNQQDLPAEVREDARLIRSEVDHCQMILRRMRTGAGGFMAEILVDTNVRDLVDQTLAELADAEDVSVVLPDGAERVRLHLPVDSVAQAIRALLQNALDAVQQKTGQPSSGQLDAPTGAGPTSGPIASAVFDSLEFDPLVSLRVNWTGRSVTIVVQDKGPGMSSEAAERAGEPFFTTKEPGRGMGLGLFLTRSVIERLGGKLQIESTPGSGVTARVELPRLEEKPGR